MERLTWKIRISVLWLFMAVAMSAHNALAFMDPAAMEELGEMQMSAGMFVFMALFWLIPLIMAFLSLTLKDSANRWANIVLGIVFTLLNIWHLVEHLTTALAVHQILIIASTVVVTALIAWYAWKWPRQVA
jgi:predicted membrane channel-forming protein YqfA (hemolysin III family)